MPDAIQNNRWTILSVVVGSGVALLVLLTGPILVGAYVETLGLSEQDAGFVFSGEMFGLTCGAIAMFAALSRSHRQVLILAVSIMVVGNAATTVVETPMLLAALRFLTGVGSGMLMTLTIVVVGTMRNTDVVFGIWTVGQLLFGAAGLIVFPSVVAASGLAGVFAIIALVSAALFATAPFYSRSAGPAPGVEPEAGAARPVGLICLAGIFVYYAGQAAVWAYLERVGVNWQLQPALIAKILFAGLFAGIAGAMLAVVVGDRAGRRLPIIVSLSLSALSIALLLYPGDVTRFVAAACLFNLGWYLFLPYSSAVVASIDRRGELLTGLGVVFPASLAAGPAFAAIFITDGDLRGPLIVGLTSVPIGLLGILPATRTASSRSTA